MYCMCQDTLTYEVSLMCSFNLLHIMNKMNLIIFTVAQYSTTDLHNKPQMLLHPCNNGITYYTVH